MEFFKPFDGIIENHSIVSVEKLTQNGIYEGLKIKSLVKGTTLVQHILTLPGNEEYVDLDLGIAFKGSFAVVTTNAQNELIDVYLGNASILTYGNTNLSFKEGKGDAFVEWKNGQAMMNSKNN